MKSIWIFCDEGKIGSLSQAKALANGLNIKPIIHILKRNFFYKILPKYAGFLGPCILPSFIKSPYPDLVIGIGRISVIPTLALRKHCKTVFIQNPRISTEHFDIVIAPQHDRIKGSNVIEVIGALHKVSPRHLKTLNDKIYKSEKKIIGVFIGGDSKHCTYSDETVIKLCKHLTRLHNLGYDLLISTSRRTKKRHVDLIHLTLGEKALHIWDLSSKNPYWDYLVSADKFVVTTDSISMMSELCSTGKPTYLFDVGIKKEKFQVFIKTLLIQGYAKLLKNSLVPYEQNILDQLPNCIDLVKRILKIKDPTL